MEYLLANKIMTDIMINEMMATGGLLLLAIGLNMLRLTKIRIGNLLPSLLFTVVIVLIFFGHI